MQTIKVLRVDPKAKLPTKASAGSAGFDLYANIDRPVELGPRNHYDFPTGIKVEIPEGFELQVRPRSGLSFKFAVEATFGTIDSDYRGEIKVNLINHGRTSYVVAPGDRIAQVVLAPIIPMQFEEVDALSKTDRGHKGFGSTGR